MDGKTFAKAIGNYFFTEVLCLFLALTLSAIGGTLLRIISMICTLGILLCIYINFAVNAANRDRLQKREAGLFRRIFLSTSVSLPYVLFGICLILAKLSVLPATFYRWYKLLDAPFLQLCNLFCADITIEAVSWGKVIVLAVLNLLPFLTVWVTYTLTRMGVTLETLQYKKK